MLIQLICKYRHYRKRDRFQQSFEAGRQVVQLGQELGVIYGRPVPLI